MFLNHGDLTSLVINDVRAELRLAPRPANALRDEVREAIHGHTHREVRVRAGPSAAPPGWDDPPTPVAIEPPVRKGPTCPRVLAARPVKPPFAALAITAG